MKDLLTHDIGSLSKPNWRVKALAGSELNEKDLEEARKWGEILAIEKKEDLFKLLTKRGSFTTEEKKEILIFSSLFATRLLEKAGLDLIWDGEQHRVEMYEFPIRRIEGFKFHGHVRSFDNKYYDKASCVQEPFLPKPYHVEEYEQIAAFTKKPIKIPLTGAYTLVDWSFDEHYLSSLVPGNSGLSEERQAARGAFFSAMAERILYPNIKALIEKGVKFIQIDEPAATTKRNEIPYFIQATKQSIGDFAGKAFFSVHICFSDYQLLFPHLLDLQGILDEVHFEYANRDSRELGTGKEQRKGYEILQYFKDTSFKVGLGVLDVHTDFIEPPELIRDRILHATTYIEPSRLFIAPDCGLRTRTWEVAFKKLQNMIEGKDLAANALGIKL